MSGLFDEYTTGNNLRDQRLRTKVTKGRGSRAAGVAMAYKLIDAPHPQVLAISPLSLVTRALSHTYPRRSA